MPADTEREADLRSEHIDAAVKAVVKIEEKWKALCAIDTSSAYTESYFRETNDDDTDGGTYSPIKGIPEFVAFPYVDVTETLISSVIEKYGATSLISMEAGQYATVPMLQRKIYRIGRKIIYQQDKAIHDAVTVVTTGYGNTVAVAVGYEWDSDTIANRDPIKTFLDAVQTLRVDGIDALNGNGYIVLNGTDYTNVAILKASGRYPIRVDINSYGFASPFIAAFFCRLTMKAGIIMKKNKRLGLV